MEAARALLNWDDVFFTTTDSPSVVVIAEENSTEDQAIMGYG